MYTKLNGVIIVLFFYRCYSVKCSQFENGQSISTCSQRFGLKGTLPSWNSCWCRVWFNISWSVCSMMDVAFKRQRSLTIIEDDDHWELFRGDHFEGTVYRSSSWKNLILYCVTWSRPHLRLGSHSQFGLRFADRSPKLLLKELDLVGLLRHLK